MLYGGDLCGALRLNEGCDVGKVTAYPPEGFIVWRSVRSGEHP